MTIISSAKTLAAHFGPWLKSLDLIAPVTSVITGSDKGETLAASQEGQVVLGLGGPDTLYSSFDRTGLSGGSGDDKLTTTVTVPGQTGADLKGAIIQAGGSGKDHLEASLTFADLDFSNASKTYTGEIVADGGGCGDVITVTNNVAGIGTQGTKVAATLINTVNGDEGDDTINSTVDSEHALGSSSVKNVIDGGSGNDHIVASTRTAHVGDEATAVNQIKGGSGDDVIEATARSGTNGRDFVQNIIDAGSGNDVVKAVSTVNTNSATSSSDNVIDGGSGNDILDLQASTEAFATNRMLGGSGNDSLSITASSHGFVPSFLGTGTLTNSLDGGNGDDRLFASAEGSFSARLAIANTLKGGSGNDRLEANLTYTAFKLPISAVNSLDGGSGNDWLKATIEVTNADPGRSQMPDRARSAAASATTP